MFLSLYLWKSNLFWHMCMSTDLDYKCQKSCVVSNYVDRILRSTVWISQTVQCPAGVCSKYVGVSEYWFTCCWVVKRHWCIWVHRHIDSLVGTGLIDVVCDDWIDVQTCVFSKVGAGPNLIIWMWQLKMEVKEYSHPTPPQPNPKWLTQVKM